MGKRAQKAAKLGWFILALLCASAAHAEEKLGSQAVQAQATFEALTGEAKPIAKAKPAPMKLKEEDESLSVADFVAFPAVTTLPEKK